jgi:hypothetical protein
MNKFLRVYLKDFLRLQRILTRKEVTCISYQPEKIDDYKIVFK